MFMSKKESLVSNENMSFESLEVVTLINWKAFTKL